MFRNNYREIKVNQHIKDEKIKKAEEEKVIEFNEIIVSIMFDTKFMEAIDSKNEEILLFSGKMILNCKYSKPTKISIIIEKGNVRLTLKNTDKTIQWEIIDGKITSIGHNIDFDTFLTIDTLVGEVTPISLKKKYDKRTHKLLEIFLPLLINMNDKVKYKLLGILIQRLNNYSK
jgi:hypothetical protein